MLNIVPSNRFKKDLSEMGVADLTATPFFVTMWGECTVFTLPVHMGDATFSD